MTDVANDIGNRIITHYEQEYLEALFDGGLVIEDVIFQILVECARVAYLVNSPKYPVICYIEEEGLETDLARKELKRTVDYVEENDIADNSLEEIASLEL